ncbi:T9SS type A sorting domain-containing protein [Flavobacterium sp.]|uniref:T9SS type A sorting domain-containing protein n=1 Tax=Flavobacterium sp. TaxID=239 RepID=UPI00286A54F1|nr:T9SS type A sorting domain-containing protein [Flavobacterium sp.]
MKKTVLFILLVCSFSVNAQFWTTKATGFATPSRSLNSISIVDANVIWANAFDNAIPATPDYSIKEFTRSTDGGATWTPGTMSLGANTAGLGISSITAVSSSTAWISAFLDTGTTNGGIWKTTDNGATWNKQPTALFNDAVESYANFVYFWDANNGIAQGDPESNEFEIYTTTNGGANWTRVPGANIPDLIFTDENPDPIIVDLVGEYGYNNLYTVVGNTIWFGTDRGRIFKSVDKGLNWTVATSPSSDFGNDRFTFSDANKGLLMIYNPPKLHKTTDGGATWNPITTTGFYNTDIAYIPGTSKVVSAASVSPIGSAYSKDDGLTWTNIDGVAHSTLAFLNDTFGFSAGLNTNATTGGISKYTGTQLAVEKFDVKSQIYAYPNPTNGQLKLDSAVAQINEVVVFDLLGKQVFDAKFLGLNNVDLDLNSLQTGMYFLKVTTDTGTIETMKVVKK